MKLKCGQTSAYKHVRIKPSSYLICLDFGIKLKQDFHLQLITLNCKYSCSLFLFKYITICIILSLLLFFVLLWIRMNSTHRSCFRLILHGRLFIFLCRFFWVCWVFRLFRLDTMLLINRSRLLLGFYPCGVCHRTSASAATNSAERRALRSKMNYQASSNFIILWLFLCFLISYRWNAPTENVASFSISRSK